MTEQDKELIRIIQTCKKNGITDPAKIAQFIRELAQTTNKESKQ